MMSYISIIFSPSSHDHRLHRLLISLVKVIEFFKYLNIMSQLHFEKERKIYSLKQQHADLEQKLICNS